MKKAAVQKAAAESRQRYAQAAGGAGGRSTRQARSEVDLSQIPGSCGFLRKQFDAAEVSGQIRALKCSFNLPGDNEPPSWSRS